LYLLYGLYNNYYTIGKTLQQYNTSFDWATYTERPRKSLGFKSSTNFFLRSNFINLIIVTLGTLFGRWEISRFFRYGGTLAPPCHHIETGFLSQVSIRFPSTSGFFLSKIVLKKKKNVFSVTVIYWVRSLVLIELCNFFSMFATVALNTSVKRLSCSNYNVIIFRNFFFFGYVFKIFKYLFLFFHVEAHFLFISSINQITCR